MDNGHACYGSTSLDHVNHTCWCGIGKEHDTKAHEVFVEKTMNQLRTFTEEAEAAALAVPTDFGDPEDHIAHRDDWNVPVIYLNTLENGKTYSVRVSPSTGAILLTPKGEI